MSSTPSPAPASTPWFDLRPAARAAHGETPARSLAHCLLHGAVAIGLVFTAAYSLWAYNVIRYGPLLYAAIAGVMLLLSPLTLAPLVAGRRTLARFTGLFVVAFLLYAVAWCAFWFGLRGRHLADLWGAIAGLAALTALFRRSFGHPGGARGFLPLLLGIFVLHSAGYYLGGELHAQFGRTTGRLLWGIAHGIGFGAGLGWLLHRLQAK